MDLFTLSAALTLNSAEFNAGLKAAEQQGQSSASAFGKMAEGIKGAFNFAAVTSAIGSVVSNIYEVGVAYDTAFAKVGTIADSTKVSTQDMSDAILNLSKETGVAATEISESVYSAISGGVDTADAVATVGTAIQLAKGGFTDAATAIDVLTTATNAYSGAAGSMDHISDVLIATQNKGKTTVGDLAANMGKVIPTAAAYGVSIENLGAAYAVMTASGINTAQSTTELNSMFLELGDSSKDVAKILKEKTGKSFADLMDGGSSLNDVMGILMDSVGGDTTAFNELWGSTTAGAAALALATAESGKFDEALDEMQNVSGQTQAAYDQMSATVGEKTAVLGNLLTVTGQQIFTSVSPMIVGALDAIQEPAANMLSAVATAVDGAVQWMGGVGEAFTTAMDEGFSAESVGGIFNAMFGEGSVAANAMTGVVAAGGKIIDGIGQAMATGDRSNITNAVNDVFGEGSIIATGINNAINLGGAIFDGISNILSADSAGEALEAAFNMIFGPEGIIATILTGFADGAAAWIATAWSFITGESTTASDVKAWFEKTFNDAYTAITTAFANVGTFFSDIWTSITSALQNAATWFSTTFKGAWDGIKFAFAGVASFFSGIWQSISGAFKSATTWFSSKFNKVWTAIKVPFAGVGSFFSGIWRKITGAFSGAASWFQENVTDKIAAAWESVTGAIQPAISAMASFLGIGDGTMGDSEIDYWKAIANDPSDAMLQQDAINKLRNAGVPGYAVGLDYVPYDNYAARLHEGEMVLTKAEADQFRRDKLAADIKADAKAKAAASSSGAAKKPAAKPAAKTPGLDTGEIDRKAKGMLDDYWKLIETATKQKYGKPTSIIDKTDGLFDRGTYTGEDIEKSDEETRGVLEAMGESTGEAIGGATDGITGALSESTGATIDKIGDTSSDIINTLADSAKSATKDAESIKDATDYMTKATVDTAVSNANQVAGDMEKDTTRIETTLGGVATTISANVADAVRALGVVVSSTGVYMSGEGYDVTSGQLSAEGTSTFEKRKKLLEEQLAWEKENGVVGGITQHDIDAWVEANKDRKYFNKKEKEAYEAAIAADKAAADAAKDPARLKFLNDLAAGLDKDDRSAAAKAEKLVEKKTAKYEPGSAIDGSHAVGLDYVPFNDYIAQLHEGEAVLTKAEAMAYRGGGSNPFFIDYDKLAQAVAGAIAGMSVKMDGQTVGDIVTETVSRNIARSASNLRYAR